MSDMLLTKREWPVAAVTLLYLCAFTLVALRGANYEFVLYAGVVLLVAGVVFWSQHKVRFSTPLLWGLAIWGLLHMAGGNVPVGEDVLYRLQLVRKVLRYDQLVHAFGFAVAALVCHHLLRPYLKHGFTRPGLLCVLVVAMSSGIGALNEIVEFIAVLSVPETGVGGYENTLWDLVFNLIGGSIAGIWLYWRYRRPITVIGATDEQA